MKIVLVIENPLGDIFGNLIIVTTRSNSYTGDVPVEAHNILIG
jgi:hypothetical protein